MFAISEIRPFPDGNERIARIMMNAELVKEEQSRILIPTVYRDDYLSAFRKLTRQEKARAFVRMPSKIHEYSTKVTGSNMDDLQMLLEETNAFREHDEAKFKMKITANKT